ncbi:MAG: HAMP domain-containing histidine kinase [Siculibacillus sp.]|nr:HAMP domain-containing histidine kinase [Siculibacillus sp.]
MFVRFKTGNRFRRIPRTVLAATVGAMLILAVTALTSRVAIHMQEQPERRLIARLGEVYLDGLSASVAPHVIGGRRADLQRALERVATYHDGVREARIVIRSPEGEILADLKRDALSTSAAPPPLGAEVDLAAAGDRNRFWVQRPLMVGDEWAATLSAQLDLKPIRDERFTAALKSLAVNAALAVGLAAASFVLLHRLLAPLKLLESALGRAAAGDPQPVSLVAARPLNRRILTLLREYNRMTEAVVERRQMRLAQAERLRTADLGRLAATIAHEVRNPLAGMLNAVDTARRYRDNREAVAQSLDLLERGLSAIERVVETTLSLHRPPTEGQDIRKVDFDDLERLIAPVAARRDVRLDWRADLDGSLPLESSVVRQIVLNLAINAVNAAQAGGAIAVRAAAVEGGLVLEVADDGPGIDPGTAGRLSRLDLDRIDTTDGGIGLGVVVLAVSSLGGRIETRRGEDPPSTTIVVHLPARGDTAATDREGEAA